MKTALKSQYHAALDMLRGAIGQCPDGAWDDPASANRFWHVAYHVLFYTDLYLCQAEGDFKRPACHQADLNFLGEVPSDPPRQVDRSRPLTRPELLEYCSQLDGRVDDAVDSLDLTAGDSGFWWYRMTKLEHQLVNLRHLQHHTGQLVERVREAGGGSVPWVGSAGGTP